MKKRFTVLILIFLTKMLTAGPESFFETTYRNAVAENLRFLDGKFPNKPGKGYPWLSVTINHQRAILICPEDGLGDALLVFEDGSVKRKSARSEGVRLSFYTTIKPLSGDKWHELKTVSGWENLPMKKTEFFAASITRHFTDAFFKAVHEAEVEK